LKMLLHSGALPPNCFLNFSKILKLRKHLQLLC
jgi:hypothetical protein